MEIPQPQEIQDAKTQTALQTTPIWCSDEIKLSPEVTAMNSSVYIIRADTSKTRRGLETGEICFVFEEEVADHVLESLAKHEVKALTNDKNRVYMEIHTENTVPYIQKKIDIHIQELGILYNGSIVKVATFGYTRVPYATFRDGLTPPASPSKDESKENLEVAATENTPEEKPDLDETCEAGSPKGEPPGRLASRGETCEVEEEIAETEEATGTDTS
jgi:hypothetical protein